MPQQKAGRELVACVSEMVALAVCFYSPAIGPLLCSRAHASVGNKIKRGVRWHVCLRRSSVSVCA